METAKILAQGKRDILCCWSPNGATFRTKRVMSFVRSLTTIKLIISNDFRGEEKSSKSRVYVKSSREFVRVIYAFSRGSTDHVNY